MDYSKKLKVLSFKEKPYLNLPINIGYYVFNRFNFMILISNAFLIVFLNFYTTKTNFIEFNQVDRLFYLSIEILASIFIYFFIARIINGKPLRTLLN